MVLRVGVLGYGFMGRAHASALARLPMFFPDVPEVERTVIIGRDEQAVEVAAERFGFANATTGWHAALDGIDVLYNLGPNHLHPGPSREALDRDIHVLCEKPLAHDLDAAQEMTGAAFGSDARTATGFNYRFLPAIRLAGRLVDEGVLGELRQFRARYLQDWLLDPSAPWSWRLDEGLAGSGALGDLGAHTIDLARYLVGDIDRVSGHLRSFVDERPDPSGDGTMPVTTDDAFSAHLEFLNGAMGRIEASRIAAGHGNDHTISLHGTEGSLRFSLERLNELAVHRADGRGYETIMVTDHSDPYVDHWWPPGHTLGWEHSLIHENAEFLGAIDDGSDFHPNFKDGLAVQQVLDAISRSDDTSSWRSVPSE